MAITVENCTSLNISVLQKTIRRLIGVEFPSATEEQRHEIMTNHLRKFHINEQYFEFESIENYLGGYRWFFLCPKCKNRATKLFLPPKDNSDKEPQYYCKKCHGLRNQSALIGQNKIYKKVTKPLKRLKIIQDTIARGHLKPSRIKELLDEHDRIERELKDSSEYRLYTFKKKYNL